MHQSEPRSGLERGKKHTRHTGSGVWSQEITSFCILLALRHWGQPARRINFRAGALSPPRRRQLKPA